MVAATNRLDCIDAALLSPGRFEHVSSPLSRGFGLTKSAGGQIVYVPAPQTPSEREEILTVCLRCGLPPSHRNKSKPWLVTANVLACQETTENSFQTNFAYFHHIRYQNKENLKSVTNPVWHRLAVLTSSRKFLISFHFAQDCGDAAGNFGRGLPDRDLG
jgi:hypothetical protein